MNMPEKIKTQRKKKGFTLKVLAEKVGCSSAYISQIEAGKALPSISALKKIAEILEIDIKDLIIGEKEEEKFFLTKSERTQIIYPQSHIKAELLVSKVSNKEMEPVYKIIPVGCYYQNEYKHNGEEFGYILKGKLELRVGSQSSVLEAGDSFYFSSLLPHTYKNVGDTDVEAIWVVAPPII
ncbi:MAG: MerR family transcriptional regulator [Desulfurella sp.]|uniref:helix-turn-helix domain-containing protein n=1 Tax=Desulfurella sp. TaxID=1962857 RepID=UPI000CBF39CC|nr:XRE family transcriptional regulator [Desulfurella sp.]PMP92438.1 MAG: MerR family transcriptional regulator [Desulfurella sp.]HEX13235.1 XRE family transcriptional regulator [Desulfurella acetivorans]